MAHKCAFEYPDLELPDILVQVFLCDCKNRYIVIRHVAKILLRGWGEGGQVTGARVPPPKNENSSDLAHYFWGCGAVVFIYFNYLVFRHQGAMAAVPPPPLGYALDRYSLP